MSDNQIMEQALMREKEAAERAIRQALLDAHNREKSHAGELAARPRSARGAALDAIDRITAAVERYDAVCALLTRLSNGEYGPRTSQRMTGGAVTLPHSTPAGAP